MIHRKDTKTNLVIWWNIVWNKFSTFSHWPFLTCETSWSSTKGIWKFIWLSNQYLDACRILDLVKKWSWMDKLKSVIVCQSVYPRLRVRLHHFNKCKITISYVIWCLWLGGSKRTADVLYTAQIILQCLSIVYWQDKISVVEHPKARIVHNRSPIPFFIFQLQKFLKHTNTKNFSTYVLSNLDLDPSWQ